MLALLNRRNSAKAMAVAMSLNLGACFGGGGSDFQVGEALELGLGVATLGLAVAGASSGSGSGSRGTTSTYVAPTGNGYSQKGAFDDCAKLYGSVGASAQMAECKRRSANMGSLR